MGTQLPTPKKGDRAPLGTEVGISLGDIVLDGDPAPPPRVRGTQPPFSAHVYCSHGLPSQLYCSTLVQAVARKRFALSFWTVVCLSCPVCDVGVLLDGLGCIGMEVGLAVWLWAQMAQEIMS